jgi:serine/threonine-protein kinase
MSLEPDFTLDTKPAARPGPFGKFYLQELINSGGMADIWVATAPDGKTYALRKLHSNLRFDFVARRRFVRGCEILKRIHGHENIITYIEHGKCDGTLYCLMEYVESSNLKLLMARQDALLADHLGNILIDMAVALEHVHDSGFMHLDFKPENVLVTRNGSVRLIDFDLAQPKPDAPRKFSKNPGTPAYMAPEQLQREAYDQRADLFAYGVTAYEILAGRKPFEGDNARDILASQLDRGSFVNPREFNAEIPPALEKVILKCLERDPERRYPIASLLVLELKSALYV